ncbi:hypothetical protein KNO15_06150 [Leifsonia shinshuensis]|uniref:hypothetical protein n=1 Tax=Leifsonia shinshuensis TaxID=150026 RepID=UPI001F50DAD8|nr:hypothetical protein [Leifsonia shinshuensis]MCI0156276.1 hypothetical protein [Leifsonia shinshuensis]
MQLTRLAAVAAALAVTGLAVAGLAGCTGASNAHTPSPTVSVSTADWPTAQVYQEGRATEALVLPSGARTLHVDFTCTYGLYSVSVETGIDTRAGSCGGAQSFDFDVSKLAPGTRVAVDLVVPDGTRLAATLRFSAHRFAPDPATKRQCAALAPIIEAYFNADQGFDHGDVDVAQWTQKTVTAKADLTALAARATADGAGSGLLGTVLPRLADWLTGAGDHPGGILHAAPGDFAAANDLASQICNANGTPMVIRSDYGG